MKTNKPVALRDIAERVGVSRMTVSLALRGDGRIRESTRQAIQAAAQALGYAPNPRLGELMSETARTRYAASGEVLAVVTSEPTREGWRQFDPGDTYRSIEARAAEYGYRVEPWWLADPSLPPQRVNQILWARGVRGIVIPCVSHQCFVRLGGTLPIDWERFCAVDIGGGLKKPAVHAVHHNHLHGLFLALDRLEALGYRRVGLCLRAEDDLRTCHRWVGAYHVWRALRGHVTAMQPLVLGELRRTEVCRWVRANQIEAVVSLRDLPLARWGFRVPEELGYAALHLWGEETVGYSGIDQQDQALASAAVDLLVMLLRRKQTGIPEHPMNWVLKGRWVDGTTTRQLRPAPADQAGIENEWLHSAGSGLSAVRARPAQIFT